MAFANSTSWAAVIAVLSGGGKAVNLQEDLAVMTNCFNNVWDGELLAFFLLLAFCSQSSSLVCSVRVSSCSLWVAGSVWRILCQSLKCFFECYLEDFIWGSIHQVGWWLVCFGMLPNYAMSALCEFYCCHNNQPRPFKIFLEPNGTLWNQPESSRN